MPGLVYSAGEIRDDELLRRRMTTAVSGPVLALVVTTDGLLNVALREKAPFPPFFRPLVSSVATAKDRTSIDESLARFLTSDRVATAASDDLTLIVVADREGVAEQAKRWTSERP